MVGREIIEHLRMQPDRGTTCRSCASHGVQMTSSLAPDMEIGWVAATVLREHTDTGTPIELPAPPDGVVRFWMKNSWFNPRALDVELADRFTAVVEWTRDYVDVPEDDVLLAGAKPEALDDPKGVLRLVVAHRLARRPRSVHKTFAVEQGPIGEDFKVYEEYNGPKEAIQRFSELLEDRERESHMTEDEMWLLRANGLLGLSCTVQGRLVLEKVREAVGNDLLQAPIPYDEYAGKVDDPLTEEEASVLVNLGVLCSRCPGMTWGETGYEVMRGMRGA